MNAAKRYVACPRAMHQLAQRLAGTPDEMAAWIWLGPNDGGIAAYLNANELDPPPRFHYNLGDCSGDGGDFDYVSPLMACWFRADEIAVFDPTNRYITGKMLVKRWGDLEGLEAVAFIRAKIAESRLLDTHPIYGCTLGTLTDEPSFPPLTSGLFLLAEVEAIEAEDFAGHGVRAGALVSSVSHPTTNLDSHIASDAARTAEGSSLPVALSSSADADERGATGKSRRASGGPCSVFLDMPKLGADEVKIAFVGDRSESGLGANNMLEISARGTTKRVALAALGLVDLRQGTLNSQGAVLLGMVHERSLTSTAQNQTRMTRLRRVFRTNLGVNEPFHPYRPGAGWTPRFTIEDRRGLADERARNDAERKTVSLEELAERGVELGNGSRVHHAFGSENDAAGDWLKNNDPETPA